MDGILTTAHLVFRTWTPDDAALAWELWGDAEVTRLIGGPFTQKQVEERLRKEISTQDGRGVQYWPLFLREGETFVGCCGLRPHWEELELGFHLLRAWRGKGLAFEAASAVIGHAAAAFPGVPLFAGHHPENAPSAALLGKLGFERTGERLYVPTGLMHPSYRRSPVKISL